MVDGHYSKKIKCSEHKMREREREKEREKERERERERTW
jgi:hypothetical protein